MSRELAYFLRKVWDQIVAPVVDFLQTTLHLDPASGGAPLPSSLYYPCTLLVHFEKVNEISPIYTSRRIPLHSPPSFALDKAISPVLQPKGNVSLRLVKPQPPARATSIP